MRVKYAGPLKDYSGYGEASRHHVAALLEAGVEVIPQKLQYTRETSNFGKLSEMLEHLPKTGDFDIKLLHTTPDEFQRLHEPGKYHIGFMYWETDRIPQAFAEGLGFCDEVWTASESNVAAIRSAGVKQPIYVFPQPADTDREWPEPYEIADFDGYLFYSIFEWTDRKNPLALIRAYFTEFGPDDNVGLLLKTYFRNFSAGNRHLIDAAIGKEKHLLAQQKYPPLFLYRELMDRTQVERIHVTGDCFVSAHRGEGWGIPQVEAALAGNPIISTGYGGCHEYFTNGEDALLLPFEMAKVRGMEHSSHWYQGDQKWADVDEASIRQAMRKCYEEREFAEKLGKRARQTACERFSFASVGQSMADRLKTIEKERTA